MDHSPYSGSFHDDLKAAKSAIQLGGAAAFFVAVVSALFLAIAWFADLDDGAGLYFSDPLLLIDVTLISLLGYGVLKRSRTAATMLFVYFLLGKVLQFAELGSLQGAPIAIVMTIVFGRAVWGTFRYHALVTSTDRRQPTGWGTRIAVGSATLLFVAMASLSVYDQFFVVTSSHVLRGDEVPAEHLAELRNADVLLEDEEVAYFFSEAQRSVLETGVLLTRGENAAVVMYNTLPDQGLTVYAIPLHEVVSITEHPELSNIYYSVYTVTGTAEDAWIQLPLSTEYGRDDDFMDELRANIP